MVDGTVSTHTTVTVIERHTMSSPADAGEVTLAIRALGQAFDGGSISVRGDDEHLVIERAIEKRQTQSDVPKAVRMAVGNAYSFVSSIIRDLPDDDPAQSPLQHTLDELNKAFTAIGRERPLGRIE